MSRSWYDIRLPAAKHHFTRIKQIEALIGIAEDPNTDMGFMARLMTLCSLPRTDPGNCLQYRRQNGPYKLVMIAGGDNKPLTPPPEKTVAPDPGQIARTD